MHNTHWIYERSNKKYETKKKFNDLYEKVSEKINVKSASQL